MGLADYLVKNHAALARVVFPTAIGFGFIYTVKTGRTPLEDVSAAARGETPESRAASLQFRVSNISPR
eukprot:jgi/Botrbrau1/3772/Bobra.0183s0007.1